ncbi:hypothetical protein [Cohnella soli]|uniref:Uncharacterized protein n=1 Tax=Cohnella soli TaxID=425005 RepID=A0ABW0HMC3_9BACL
MSQATLDLILVELRNFRTEVNEEFQHVHAEIRTLKTDVQELKADVQTLKTDVQTLKADVQKLKADVEILKTDVQKLKTDVETLQTDMEKMHKEQQAFGKRLNSHKEMYAQLIGTTVSIKNMIAEQNEELERRVFYQFHSQAASIEVLYREQLSMKRDIELLKTAIQA